MGEVLFADGTRIVFPQDGTRDALSLLLSIIPDADLQMWQTTD
jgi:hypothetical protein